MYSEISAALMRALPQIRAFVVLLAVLPLSGCLFRSHKVEQPITPTAGAEAADRQARPQIAAFLEASLAAAR
jgi:hypothetical protein